MAESALVLGVRAVACESVTDPVLCPPNREQCPFAVVGCVRVQPPTLLMGVPCAPVNHAFL